ncbi:MAG TPA: chalcone isomerase family protein [Aquabacterium sp.]|nr:chalcone isomerase family protein [Aquabacterium sp.]HQC99085.1 chalcone isomerase family protein [Aquabacterium sp.]
MAMALARRPWLLAALAGLLSTQAPTQAQAQAAASAPAAGPPPPPELADALPGARWRGAGVMRFLGLHIYDARLWSPEPVGSDSSGQALALELVYARKLVGRLIAERSLKEMQGVGPVSDAQGTQWLQAMLRLFPDVQAGDRLTGIQRPGQSARFFFNGKLRGEVADADFTRLFFGIWLSPRTSEPQLRAQLLGQT